ncbi:MAG TPA: hypothetical protein DC049_18475, partial [Spirochaetia bacterium]|nr:hypothetical protein [Spirochaetia bacterium]
MNTGCAVHPEITAPAGSFDAAVKAFEAGAESVYFGLKRFSARSQAKNFSHDDFRRLSDLAGKLQKKIYLAVNTLVKETELEEAYSEITFCRSFGINAVIIQDIGLADLIHAKYPDLPLHASTQTVCSDTSALIHLKKAGFCRAVLPRESTVRTIIETDKAIPDMELEVFIHGALCYSVSGLCLASGLLIGRSGNRGECAQLCRNYYTDEDSGITNFPLSCRDLFTGDRIQQLAAAGVKSLKIEGRMKSPEYVFHTVRYYRELLDRGFSNRPEAHKSYFHNLRLCFAREFTGGFLSGQEADILQTDFPGHTGIILGNCLKTAGNNFTVKTNTGLAVRDGILFFRASGEPVMQSVRKLEIGCRPVYEAADGTECRVFADQLPAPGDKIFLISRRALDLAETNPLSLPMAKIKIRIKAAAVILPDQAENLSVTLSAAWQDEKIHRKMLCRAEPSRKDDFTIKLKSLLQESGSSLFTPEQIEISKNYFYDQAWFVLPAELKKLKNEFYKKLDLLFTFIPKLPGPQIVSAEKNPSVRFSALLGKRSALGALLPGSVFFPFWLADLPAETFYRSCGACSAYVLPLAPFYETGRYIKSLLSLLDENPGKDFLIGLNSFSHLEIVPQLAHRHNLHYFTDFFLYTANSFSMEYMKKNIPQLSAVFYWPEGSSRDFDMLASGCQAGVPLLKCDPAFSPPLFIS